MALTRPAARRAVDLVIWKASDLALALATADCDVVAALEEPCAEADEDAKEARDVLAGVEVETAAAEEELAAAPAVQVQFPAKLTSVVILYFCGVPSQVTAADVPPVKFKTQLTAVRSQVAPNDSSTAVIEHVPIVST
jgi:hypothetical protein